MLEVLSSQRSSFLPCYWLILAVLAIIERKSRVNVHTVYVNDLHSWLKRNVRARQDAAKSAGIWIEDGLVLSTGSRSEKSSDLILTSGNLLALIKMQNWKKHLKPWEEGSFRAVLISWSWLMINSFPPHSPTRIFCDCWCECRSMH